jgi:aryl-alcohol dehydrogenase-like predicted oxidoreductase
MTFGEEWGWGASRKECRRVFDIFADRGGNFIDTANKYTEGTSEEWVGAFVTGRRERFVIATKYTASTDPSDPNAGGNQRKNMVQSLEASLRRLQTDYVDVFWLHVWDHLTPVEEVMRGLDDLVRAGKILYVGVSDTPAWIVSAANTLATARGWSPFVGLQVEYSLLERTPERDLLPMARTLDIAVTAWAPLAAGVLTGKYLPAPTARKRAGRTPRSRQNAGDPALPGRLHVTGRAGSLTERKHAIAAEVVALAKDIGRSPAQVALNWVRQQPWGVTIPIIGARRAVQIEDDLGCLEWRLEDEHLLRLHEVSRIELGFPHDFLRREGIRKIVYGDSEDLIDSHR